MSYRDEYWSECIGEALCEMGKFHLFTSDEITKLGKDMSSIAEMESSAFGLDVASSNLHASNEREKADLRKQLRREQAMVTCLDCTGQGRLRYNAGPWAVNTECSKCRGQGRHDA